MSEKRRKPAPKKNRFIEPEAVRLERRQKRRRCCLFGTSLFSLAALCGILCVLSYAWLTQTHFFQARIILVSGNRSIDQTEILSSAGIERGANIFAINLDVARARLTAHPWIDTVSIIREYPNRIVIQVREHRPVAIAQIGHPYLVNDRGEIFDRSRGAFPSLPVIEGLSRDSLPLAGMAPPDHIDVSHRALRELIPLLGPLTQKGGRFVVTGIEADPHTGLRLITDGATRSIVLGFGHFDKKIKRVNELFALLEKKVNRTAVASIDVRDTNSVVIKPAKS